MSVDNEIIELAKLFGKTLKKFGLKRVVHHLSQLKDDNSVSKQSLVVDRIIGEVTKDFSVDYESIKGGYVSGDESSCRTICIVLLKKHTNLSHNEIAPIFNKENHVLISTAIKQFNELDPKIKHHKKMIDVYTRVDQYIKNFQLQTK